MLVEMISTSREVSIPISETQKNHFNPCLRERAWASDRKKQLLVHQEGLVSSSIKKETINIMETIFRRAVAIIIPLDYCMTMRASINIMQVVMPKVLVSIQPSDYWKISQETTHTSALLVFHRDADMIPVLDFWFIIVGTTLIAAQLLRKVSGWKRVWAFWPIFAVTIAIMRMTTVRVFHLLQKQKTLSALEC